MRAEQNHVREEHQQVLQTASELELGHDGQLYVVSCMWLVVSGQWSVVDPAIGTSHCFDWAKV